MKGRARILVVDDEPDLIELVSYNLKSEGHDVLTSSNGEDALRRIKSGSFDLVVLDLMLPGMSGTDICRAMKAERSLSEIPVIMLTAKTGESDRVLGLELGADDYVTKPFSTRELSARVRAVLRRTRNEQAAEGKKLGVGDIELDPETYAVTRKGLKIDLSATEFRLLEYLMRRRGRVFTRDQLLSAVWKEEAFVEPRTVDVHIRRLRAKVEDDPARPAYIKTRRGIGYYMETDE